MSAKQFERRIYAVIFAAYGIAFAVAYLLTH